MLYVILNRKIEIKIIQTYKISSKNIFETLPDEKRNKKLEKFFKGRDN